MECQISSTEYQKSPLSLIAIFFNNMIVNLHVCTYRSGSWLEITVLSDRSTLFLVRIDWTSSPKTLWTFLIVYYHLPMLVYSPLILRAIAKRWNQIAYQAFNVLVHQKDAVEAANAVSMQYAMTTRVATIQNNSTIVNAKLVIKEMAEFVLDVCFSLWIFT